jgi:hypothetical protein
MIRHVNPVKLAYTGFVLLLLAASLQAQGTDLGTVRGTVSDATGAVVPKASVVITDTDTGITRKLATNGQGDYEAAGLRYGNYKVTVSLPGFNTVEISGVAVRSGQDARADVKLAPAGTQQSVVITAEAPVIETESPVISGTLDNKALLELPRDNRDIYSFLYLNPNITQADVDGDFKFIGNQSYGASFSLDGQRSNGGVFGQPTNSQPSLEAVGELIVMSNDFSAEYGGIANIRIETKRGESRYHGSAFYNNKNSALAAWNYNDKIGQENFIPNNFQSAYPTPYFNLNEAGGSFGGPVPKLKSTYFMLAYEHRWFDSPVDISSTTLPHPSMWVGDFSGLKDTAKPKVPAGVVLTADEIATDTVSGAGKQFIRIPQRLLNPVVQNFINDYFPKISTAYPINSTNGRLTEFFTNEPGIATRHLGTMRLDHDFSEKDRMFAVYNAAAADSRSNAVSPAAYTGLGLSNSQSMNDTVSLSETHLFRPNLINEARGGFNIQQSFVRSNQTLTDFLTRIGFDSSDIAAYGQVIGSQNLTTYGHPAIQFGSGIASFTNGGRNTDRPLDQSLATFGDTLTWVRGRHDIRMGADLVRNAATDGFSANRGNPRGRMNYSGTAPQSFADWILGLPPTTATYNIVPRGPMRVYNWEHGYFVQDNFRVSSKFTLNLGVRYEIITPFIEDDNLMVNFDPNYVNPTTGVPGRFVVPTQQVLSEIDPRMVAYGATSADKIGLRRSLVNIDWGKVAPRLGIAWRLADKSVLRAGYGFYFPTSAAQGSRDAMATNPFNQGVTVDNSNPSNLIEGWPGFTHGISPMTGGTVRTLSGQPSANGIPFNLKEPRIDQYNVTFEREFGWQTALRVSYLGTYMHGLITGKDLNMLPPSNTPYGTSTGDGVTACDPVNNGDCQPSPADLARQPFPVLGDYLAIYGNFGHGQSNALQLEGKRRFAGGFMFDVSYTLLDQKTSAVDSANSTLGGTAYNQFKPNADYGIDSYIPRHRFIFYSVWEPPVGHNRKYGSSMSKFAEALIGGWETSWQMFIKSGTGFTPYWICDDCEPIWPGNLASGFIDAIGDFGVGGTLRPFLTGQNPQKRIGDQYFNPDAFTVPSVGADVLDNPLVAKRNMLMGPGTWGLNLGVHKVFRFGEKLRADLGAEFNNVFNHPLFSPNSNGQDGDFANVGDFNLTVDPNTLKLQPITDFNRNPNFGRLLTSYTQEGVDSRRTVRLKLRFTF